MLAGALLFVPHAGKVPPKATASPPHRPFAAVAEVATEWDPIPEITITTEFWVPAKVAFEALILEAAAHHRVDPALVRAVVRAESAFDPLAVSSAGAEGLMQLMPGLSRELGVTDPFDPRENIFAGVRYLRYLLDVHDGNETLALASYNAGPGAVATHAGVPPFKETQRYVRHITNQLARERGVTNAPETADGG